MRKKYSSSFKTRVAIEAIKGDKTIAEISSSFEVHRDQAQKWKKTALSGISGLFSDKQSSKEKRNSEKLDDRDHPELSISKQSNLLSLSKGVFYYEPVTMDTRQYRVLSFRLVRNL